jgi:hypothetical protein
VSQRVAHPVVQEKLAAPAEVGEGRLVGSQQIGHALAQATQCEAAAAVAERHHEDVDLGAYATQRYRHLAPGALRLLARPGLEAALGDRRSTGGLPQRRHRPAHDHVAADEPPPGAVLPKDAG